MLEPKRLREETETETESEAGSEAAFATFDALERRIIEELAEDLTRLTPAQAFQRLYELVHGIARERREPDHARAGRRRRPRAQAKAKPRGRGRPPQKRPRALAVAADDADADADATDEEGGSQASGEWSRERPALTEEAVLACVAAVLRAFDEVAARPSPFRRGRVFLAINRPAPAAAPRRRAQPDPEVHLNPAEVSGVLVLLLAAAAGFAVPMRELLRHALRASSLLPRFLDLVTDAPQHPAETGAVCAGRNCPCPRLSRADVALVGCSPGAGYKHFLCWLEDHAAAAPEIELDADRVRAALWRGLEDVADRAARPQPRGASPLAPIAAPFQRHEAQALRALAFNLQAPELRHFFEDPRLFPQPRPGHEEDLRFAVAPEAVRAGLRAAADATHRTGSLVRALRHREANARFRAPAALRGLESRHEARRIVQTIVRDDREEAALVGHLHLERTADRYADAPAPIYPPYDLGAGEILQSVLTGVEAQARIRLLLFDPSSSSS